MIYQIIVGQKNYSPSQNTREIKYKSVSRFFLPKFIFCHVKNGQKSIFELGKLPKMQFHEENFFELFDLPGFFKFSGLLCSIRFNFILI